MVSKPSGTAKVKNAHSSDSFRSDPSAATVQFGASDLHVQVGSPPTVRLDGTMTAMDMPAAGPA